MRLLIKGGHLLDPATGRDEKADILIEDGRITAVGAPKVPAACRVLAAQGRIITPGLVDLHVHLREPGFEHKETIATGTRSAACGGFTSVVCMANTDPVVDNPAVVEYVRSQAEKVGAVEVYPVGSITKGLAGEELSEMGALKEAGVVAVSDDGYSVMDAGVMRRAFEYADNCSLPVFVHCEDANLTGDGVMHEGFYSTSLGLEPVPASAEETMVARDLILAEECDARIHITHVSTAGAVDLIRRAKRRGVRVTAEVTPHHFTLTAAFVEDYDPNTRVNPPLRTEEDVRAVIEGLKDGTIDCIATDHAPHAAHEKRVPYCDAPSGISGLETAFGLAYTELVQKGAMDLIEVIGCMTVNPCAVLGLDRGQIQEGEVANLAVFDLNKSWTVTAEELVTKGKNTPFLGRTLTGYPEATIVSGNPVWSEGEILC